VRLIVEAAIIGYRLQSGNFLDGTYETATASIILKLVTI